MSFKTTASQRVHLYQIASEMKISGLSDQFIADAVQLGEYYEGVYDLFELWQVKKWEKIWTSLDDIYFPLFSHFLKFDPYSRKPNSFISYIQRQFHAIHNSHSDSCVNNVGDSP